MTETDYFLYKSTLPQDLGVPSGLSVPRLDSLNGGFLLHPAYLPTPPTSRLAHAYQARSLSLPHPGEQGNCGIGGWTERVHATLK